MTNEKIRLLSILLISIIVIATGALFSYTSFRNGEFSGGILGIIIAIIIFAFALITYRKGNKDLKEGYPLRDERSRTVIQKASSLAFYISLYLLLAIGFFSDTLIKFRDVSQATGVAVGFMALIFLICWIYYSKKEI